MDLKFLTVIGLQIAGFIFVYIKLYAQSYTTEKGKNLATKQDVGGITEIVESIKSSLLLKTEELKSELSYRNENLIYLRAAERTAIINFYKSTWVLVLNITRTDSILIKYEIDYFDKDKDEVSNSKYTRCVSEAELILNKIKEELSNLKYLKDISESELMFFYDKPEFTNITRDLNTVLSEFERELIRTINLLLQVFAEITVKINRGALTIEDILEVQRKRSGILANWDDNKHNSASLIRTFNENLKKTLFERITGLTS